MAVLEVFKPRSIQYGDYSAMVWSLTQSKANAASSNKLTRSDCGPNQSGAFTSEQYSTVRVLNAARITFHHHRF